LLLSLIDNGSLRRVPPSRGGHRGLILGQPMTSAPLTGLTHAEAARRLLEIGPNELPRTQARGLIAIARDTMREPMFLLLLGAATLYMVLGDLGEGLFLLAGALAAIGLVIFQEARSEHALVALRELAQPLARVIRDGEESR